MELIRVIENETPFVVKRMLGQGAHALVFEVMDKGQTKALKVGPGLRREFELSRRVRHASLIWPEDFVEVGDLGAIVMPLLSNLNLVAEVRQGVSQFKLDETKAPRKTLPMAFGTDVTEFGQSVYAHCGSAGESKLRGYVLQLADALEELHRGGVLHLDVAKENVLIGNELAVLVDFGLAREVGDDVSKDEEVGAAAYLAPELAFGKASPACDWYSLGVVIFEALTGAFPFEGGGAEVLVRKQSLTAPLASNLCSGVGGHWDALCASLLTRRLEVRGGYAEVLELLQ